MSSTAEAPVRDAPEPVVITVREDRAETESGLATASWPRTVLRLALEPRQHPWSPVWRLRSPGRLVAVGLALLVLLLFLASGCAGVPPQSLQQGAASPRPSAPGRCETLLVSREVQVPLEGELGDLRFTIGGIPDVSGKLRVLVHRPRFDSRLELDAQEPAAFDQVLPVSPGPGQRELTVILTRPPKARSDWPRSACKACRIDVELSGFFLAREALASFFHTALQEAAAVDEAFARQSAEAPGRPSAGLRETAERLVGQARRCGVELGPVPMAIVAWIDELDRARAGFYGPAQSLPDARGLLRTFRNVADAVEGDASLRDAARDGGWPGSLSPKLRGLSGHLELMAQAQAFPPEDRALAARWIAVALAPDGKALEAQIQRLPRIRTLDDARARLAWVDPKPGTLWPLPGASRPLLLGVRELHAVRSGRRCIGKGGAAPVGDPEGDARAVATLLGADDKLQLRVAAPAAFRSLAETAGVGKELLCDAPRLEISETFAGLAQADLGPVAQRLTALFADIDRMKEGREDLVRDAQTRTNELLCGLLSEENVRRRVATVTDYRDFVRGGMRVLELLSGPMRCGGKPVSAREVRARLNDAWRAALEKHGTTGRVCPSRGGRCPEEIALSVRELFALPGTDLAFPATARSRALDDPPPFGFSEAWVRKLDRCAREACDALARLASEAPAGQFDGALCKPQLPGDERPQEVRIERPDAPTSISLQSCDPQSIVRVTLQRSREAGTLVAIASNHRFRYGSESVERQSRHPQLGHVYERVADLADPNDVSRRGEAVEVALTPSVENQVFYFFSLRRRDY